MAAPLSPFPGTTRGTRRMRADIHTHANRLTIEMRMNKRIVSSDFSFRFPFDCTRLYSIATKRASGLSSCGVPIATLCRLLHAVEPIGPLFTGWTAESVWFVLFRLRTFHQHIGCHGTFGMKMIHDVDKSFDFYCISAYILSFWGGLCDSERIVPKTGSSNNSHQLQLF